MLSKPSSAAVTLSNTGLIRKLILVVIIGALAIWAAWGTGFSVMALLSGASNMAEFLGGMFPPNVDAAGPAWFSLVETIQIAFLGSLIGLVLAFIPSFLAARNITPAWLTIPFRSLLTIIRTIPIIVWALLFVAAVGLGPFPGILATAMYTVGFVGKLFYEAIEAVDRSQVEAVQSTGASKMSVWRYGVLPQVAPHFVGYALYIFEYNVRAATVLGIVGAGGIGFYLLHYMRSFQYDMAATVILITLPAVLLIDAGSMYLRRKIL
jgi:phosphonate transport system permease protein